MASIDDPAGSKLGDTADFIAAGATRRFVGGGALYSQFVGVLKLLLPMIATALMLIVMIWPQLTSKDEGFRIGVAEISVEDAKNLRMVNPRYMGVDDADRPYALTADIAKQTSGDDQMGRLTAPKADITLEDGTWIALTAESGSYYRDIRLLDLFGSVNLYHDEGFEIHTASAQFDLAKGDATGQDPVQGQGPFGTIEAQGFRITTGGKSIIFTGKSHMVILPSADQRGG
jgi:lipopolysaccharide export system protein LptC